MPCPYEEFICRKYYLNWYYTKANAVYEISDRSFSYVAQCHKERSPSSSMLKL
ncbi:hypothetical protein H6G04_26720 [Calothrix membranacea FACHB-236]|nr:hypothetical protein [Calothrix membranacea FACHB-236]